MLIQVAAIIAALSAGEPVKLEPKTYDFTGFHSIPVTNTFDGNGATITASELWDSDSLFLFILDSGQISNVTLVGASGDRYDNKYQGAVRVRTTGRIAKVNFRNFNKWAVDIRGVRGVYTDTTYITNCTFEGINRSGYGYGIWCQYGTAVVDSCYFRGTRHAVDGSSEGNRYIIRNSTFEKSYMYAIHLHEYTGGFSGIGMDLIGNTFYQNGEYIKLPPPFPPFRHVISGNRFVCDTLPGYETAGSWNGSGFASAPIITGKDSIMAGDTLSLKASKAVTWYHGSKARTIRPKLRLPQVKVFMCKAAGSLVGKHTVTVTDTGSYTSFWMKGTGKVEVLNLQGAVIHKPGKNKLAVWRQYVFREPVTIRYSGSGVLFIDDFINNSKKETFESNITVVRISYIGLPVSKVSRTIGESASGYYSLMITSLGGSVVVY